MFVSSNPTNLSTNIDPSLTKITLNFNSNISSAKVGLKEYDIKELSQKSRIVEKTLEINEFQLEPLRKYFLYFTVTDQKGTKITGKIAFITGDPNKTKTNSTMMQAFYWEMNEGDYKNIHPGEANLWNLLQSRAEELSYVGITALWLPPASKGMNGQNTVGYDVYDLWDLGEFNQKGTVRTKYGTRAELDQAINYLHANGIDVYFDAVLNHRMGADQSEAVPLASGGTMTAWTKFNFPGRNGTYYSSTWDWTYFDGVDGNLFKGKSWDNCLDNYDYLMGDDVDYQNSKVKDEIKAWGKWIINEVDFDGFRLDAIRHVDNDFVSEWLDEVWSGTGKDVFFVGEAWIEDINYLVSYLQAVNNPLMKVFDFPLYNTFRTLSNGSLDLRSLSNVGLVNRSGYEDLAVTFADNHDTNRDDDQNNPGIANYKYQAYAYILMREKGIPCVWWKDYYVYGMKDKLDKLIEARKYFAYGPGHEVDNNDHDVYSYVREGLADEPGTGLVMMISDGPVGGSNVAIKRINSRQPNTTFYDYTGHISERVTTDDQGYGNFKVNVERETGWSIWVPVN